MGQDETGTLARLKTHRRELIDPAIADHKGRVVKTTGDGMLIEFPSVVEGVACALAIQRGMNECDTEIPTDLRIEFRIGINLGDVIVEEDDIYRDWVNIVARLEALAEPGGICISRVVRDQVRGKLDLALEDLGEQSLKNITRPVRAFRVHPDGAPTARHPDIGASRKAIDRGSAIRKHERRPGAGLFRRRDGRGHHYRSAHIKWLFVIAHNSTFVYKGKTIDVKHIGRELGVHYVRDGSVRKLGDRVHHRAAD
jgi:adenylate cyclase